MAKDLAGKKYQCGFSIDLSSFSQNPFFDNRNEFENKKIKQLLDSVIVSLI